MLDEDSSAEHLAYFLDVTSAYKVQFMVWPSILICYEPKSEVKTHKTLT